MNARPTDRLAIAVAQLNPTVGDIAGNADKARRARAEAARDGADLVALPELFLSGYPPEDLVLKPALQAACRAKIEELARETADGGPALLIGTPWAEDGKLYNAYCLLDGGAIAAVRLKVNLPNYGVFDERRVFAPGPPPGPVNFRGVRIGMPICEDIWTEWGDYEDVVECLAETGAELMIVPNGSPYSRDKDDARLNIAVARVTESDLPHHLCQPDRWAGRAGVRRRVVRPACRPLARLPAAGLPGSRHDAHAGSAPAMAGAASADPSPRWRRATRRTMPPACWGCATTSARTVSRAWCSGSPAASIPRWWRRWRSMRWAARACAA